VRLGPNGVEEVLPFGKLSAYEEKIFNEMLPDLTAQVKKGSAFVK
jgi:malate/lactate dehydrogenase